MCGRRSADDRRRCWRNVRLGLMSGRYWLSRCDGNCFKPLTLIERQDGDWIGSILVYANRQCNTNTPRAPHSFVRMSDFMVIVHHRNPSDNGSQEQVSRRSSWAMIPRPARVVCSYKLIAIARTNLHRRRSPCLCLCIHAPSHFAAAAHAHPSRRRRAPKPRAQLRRHKTSHRRSGKHADRIRRHRAFCLRGCRQVRCPSCACCCQDCSGRRRCRSLAGPKRPSGRVGGEGQKGGLV